MVVERMDAELPAGDFTTWLQAMAAALRDEAPADVPCGGCTACCTSSQFVHIGPDETDTLAHIPAELLFPAPLLPKGNVLLGYDGRGHCPMLADDRCTIYEHRPVVCRVQHSLEDDAGPCEPREGLHAAAMDLTEVYLTELRMSGRMMVYADIREFFPAGLP